jgi:hypothetical protein
MFRGSNGSRRGNYPPRTEKQAQRLGAKPDAATWIMLLGETLLAHDHGNTGADSSV